MTRAITITGFAVILLLGFVLSVWSRQPGSRVPQVGNVVGQVMRQRSGRVLAFIVWFWFGWHFLAR
jgi:Family of unknown function (DUF6186)